MGTLKNKSDEVIGKVKETVGDVTGNDKLKLKGKAQKHPARQRTKLKTSKKRHLKRLMML